MAYTKLGFVNGSAPALSATNLNHMDDGIDANDERLDALGVQSTLEAEATPDDTDYLLVKDTEDAGKVKKTLLSEIWTWIKANLGSDKANVLSAINVEDGADVTDATNVQAALTADASGGRSALGLGDSATLDVGTGAGDVAAGNAPADAVTTHESTYAHANLPTSDEKTRLSEIQAATGASTSEKVITLTGATATPAPNAIPIADGSGKLDGWVSDASTTVKGILLLGSDGGAVKQIKLPDSVGRIYAKSAGTWETVDSWTKITGGGTVSADAGNLKLAFSGTTTYLGFARSGLATLNTTKLYLKITRDDAITSIRYDNGSSLVIISSDTFIYDENYIYLPYVSITSTKTALELYVYYADTTTATGKTLYLYDVYLGDALYSDGSLGNDEISALRAIKNYGYTNIISGQPIILPPAFAVVGRECNIYFDNLIQDNASDYYWDVTCPIGTFQAERFTVIPATAGTYSLVVACYKKSSGALISSITTSLIVSSATAGGSANPNFLMVGDSTTAQTDTLAELSALLYADANLDAALIGTKGTSAAWAENTVYSRHALVTNDSGKYYYCKIVGTSAASGGPTGTGSVIVDGTVTWCFAGTIPIKHEGISGYGIVQFAENTSPFWDGSAINFSWYLEHNSLAAPDVVGIHLGINDANTASKTLMTDWGARTLILDINKIIASIQLYNSSIKIGIFLPIPPSFSQDAFGANYLTASTRWKYKYSLYKLWKWMNEAYSDRTGENIWLIPMHASLDTVHNMSSLAASPANSRTAATVVRQSNGVHPTYEGYGQMADVIYSWLKSVYS